MSDSIDRARLAASHLLAAVEVHEQLASTQDRALDIARAAAPGVLPALVVAEQQTAGRGRGANQWWTAPGSLAFSLAFDPVDWNLPRNPLPERSLAVGVAIVDTVATKIPRQRVGLHWPNDVFAGNKKLAGILIDVLPDGKHVVGIGLNVNNSFVDAPDEVRSRAASLCELSGTTFDRTEILLQLIERVKAALCDSAAAPEVFGQRFNELCLQIGQELTIQSGNERTTGLCQGIAPDGALLLEIDGNWRRFYSGVLQH